LWLLPEETKGLRLPPPKNRRERLITFFPWKLCTTWCYFVLMGGLVIRTAYLSDIAQRDFRDIVETSENVVDGRLSSWFATAQTLLTVSANTVLVVMSQILALAVRVDFVHVAGLTMVSIAMLLATNLYWDITMHFQGISLVFCCSLLVLLLGYRLDLNERQTYVSLQAMAQANIDLEHRLDHAEAELEHKAANDAEKRAVEGALSLDKDKRIVLANIPLSSIKLEKMVGQGAFGEVIKGTYNGTQVVVKRMRRNRISKQSMEEFANEIKLQVQLRHPNIVIFIGGTWDTFANVGFVLEWVDRGDLWHVLRDTAVDLEWNTPLLNMATDIARGMCYLHGQNPPVLHRDLKSLNVLVTATFSCKISDFGLSKVFNERDELEKIKSMKAGALEHQHSLKPSTAVIGSPLWVAPEVVGSGEVSLKVDVWSFGIVLVEMETRNVPYYEEMSKDGTTPTSIMLRVESEGLRPKIPKNCLAGIRNLVNRCLQTEASQRPSFDDILEILSNPDLRSQAMSRARRDIGGIRKLNLKAAAAMVHTASVQHIPLAEVAQNMRKASISQGPSSGASGTGTKVVPAAPDPTAALPIESYHFDSDDDSDSGEEEDVTDFI
jgi:serine/threonine protein kinase